MKSWYLIYCKRGQLSRAQVHLQQQQVNCFCPLQQIEKNIRGKRVVRSEPLFPNYLFINFDASVIHTTTISATRGVSHFIRFGLFPVVIPDSLIEAMQARPNKVAIEPSLPRAGDQVQITEGIFSGLSAIYAEPDGNKRSILLLNLVNKQVKYSIENSKFKKNN